MKKVYITQQQNDEIQKLIDVALNQNIDEDTARAKILETHIRKGWGGTEVESLGELTSDEMAKVLFSKNYEIKKEKLKLQEFEVTFKVRKSTLLIEHIVKHDNYKLSDEEVVRLALQRLADYKNALKLDERSVVKCELINSSSK